MDFSRCPFCEIDAPHRGRLTRVALGGVAALATLAVLVGWIVAVA